MIQLSILVVHQHWDVLLKKKRFLFKQIQKESFAILTLRERGHFVLGQDCQTDQRFYLLVTYIL